VSILIGLAQAPARAEDSTTIMRRRSMGRDEGWADRLRQGHRHRRLDWTAWREQLAHPGDVMRADAAGQQAVVANAMEAARQDVNEKAADELGDGKRHRLLAIAPLDPIILPSECDGAVSERDQPAVGDGDAMGVARQIGQNGLGSAEGSLGIDDPFDPAQRRQKRRAFAPRPSSFPNAIPLVPPARTSAMGRDRGIAREPGVEF
jgi:hypothetical protein